MPNKNLAQFFHPQSIAVIGASNTDGKVGNDVIRNLNFNFKGPIYPINPHESKILGYKAYASIKALRQTPDLAIIIIPAAVVPQEVEDCAKKGIKNFVIISAGFKEVGTEGAKLEQQLVDLKKRYGLQILGPNCLGYIAAMPPVNASFANEFPEVGNIAFISQSGALGTAILDMAAAQKIGLSYFVSLGNKCDIDEIDMLEYLADDKNTKVILLYLENISDGPRFIEVAKRVTRKKPVIVLKSGKTAQGMKAVSSHTGSLAGVAEVYSAAFKQAGAIEVEDVEDFEAVAEVMSYQELPKGNKVAVLTNAGGPGILVTDLLPKYGLELATFSKETMAKLKAGLPPAASVHNPVDIIGDALADRYAYAFSQIVKDKNVDSIIVVLTPQRMTQIAATAEAIGKQNARTKKPVILCFMGEKSIVPHYALFKKYSLPQINFPLTTVRALSVMTAHAAAINEIVKISKKIMPAPAIIKKAQALLKQSVNEKSARNILSLFGLPLHRAELAINFTEAKKIAIKIGYPLAVKVVSEQVLHKSDVGGVIIDVKNETELEKAILKIESNIHKAVPKAKIDGYLIGEMVSGIQMIVGLKRDVQFGPAIMLGLGGIYTEVFKDVVFRVAPVGAAEAQKMLSELKIYPIIKGARGQKPLDEAALIDLIVKLSELSLALPEIKEIDLNPVMVLQRGKGVKIVDVRMLK